MERNTYKMKIVKYKEALHVEPRLAYTIGSCVYMVFVPVTTLGYCPHPAKGVGQGLNLGLTALHGQTPYTTTVATQSMVTENRISM